MKKIYVLTVLIVSSFSVALGTYVDKNGVTRMGSLPPAPTPPPTAPGGSFQEIGAPAPTTLSVPSTPAKNDPAPDVYGGMPFVIHGVPTNTTLTVGNVTYREIQWGAVTPTAVSIRHSTGIARIPLAVLPPELQKEFGYDPQKVAFEKDRCTKVILDNKLVDKSHLKLITLYCYLRAKDVEESGMVGCLFKRDIFESVIVAHNRNSTGLSWNSYAQQKVGSEKVFVVASFPTNNIGDYIKIEAYEVNPVGDMRVFQTPRELTFDEWKKLQH